MQTFKNELHINPFCTNAIYTLFYLVQNKLQFSSCFNNIVNNIFSTYILTATLSNIMRFLRT